MVGDLWITFCCRFSASFCSTSTGVDSAHYPRLLDSVACFICVLFDIPNRSPTTRRGNWCRVFRLGSARHLFIRRKIQLLSFTPRCPMFPGCIELLSRTSRRWSLRGHVGDPRRVVNAVH